MQGYFPVKIMGWVKFRSKRYMPGYALKKC